MNAYSPHEHRHLQRYKKVLDPLELDLWVVVSHNVVVENRIQVLCRNVQYP